VTQPSAPRILSREEVADILDERHSALWRLAQNHKLAASIESLRSENERLRGALLFYSDKRNYQAGAPYDRFTGPTLSQMEVDEGRIAREALSPREGE
jgi:hypothetical protein